MSDKCDSTESMILQEISRNPIPDSMAFESDADRVTSGQQNGFFSRMQTPDSRNPKQQKSKRKILWYKPIVFLVALIPFLVMVVALFTNSAGPNPIEYLEKESGEWSIRFLLLSLAMTPASQLLKKMWPIKIRRMIGLFAFFYVSVHMLVYAVFDQSLNLGDIWQDIVERPFITIGFVGFLILLPLAVTSNKIMIAKLGTRWRALHKWVYLAALAGVTHYLWLAKGEIPDPVVYLLILVLLLGYRVVRMLR